MSVYEEKDNRAPSVHRTRSSPWVNPKRLNIVYTVHYKTVMSRLHVVYVCREECERLGFTHKKEDARISGTRSAQHSERASLVNGIQSTASGVKHTLEKNYSEEKYFRLLLLITQYAKFLFR